MINKILIGGAALRQLGSSRYTLDTDYLIKDLSKADTFICDHKNKIDYINANGHDFFNDIYSIEEGNEIATPQSLLELKAFAFVQHCQNMKFQKADDCEYDIKFLCRKFGLTELKTVKKYISAGELKEIEKVIKSVKL